MTDYTKKLTNRISNLVLDGMTSKEAIENAVDETMVKESYLCDNQADTLYNLLFALKLKHGE